MTTAIDAASQDRAEALLPTATATTRVHLGTTPPRPVVPHPVAQAPVPDISPQAFIDAHRIHLRDGSLFIDSYLVLHPQELDPANEPALRKKLQLTYSLNQPSFFDHTVRKPVAFALGQLIPPSVEAQQAVELSRIAQVNYRVDHPDATTANQIITDKKAPFAAIVRDTTQPTPFTALELESRQNSLAVYLLLREKLTQQGYLKPLTDYFPSSATTTDQVLANLTDKVGVTPLALREAGAQGGLDAIGQQLGLDAGFVQEVKAIVHDATNRNFSLNLIENWHIGRHLPNAPAAQEEKIATGLQARITGKIAEFRGRLQHRYALPAPLVPEEKRIADALLLVEPEQRALLYKLGYEISFTPDYYTDALAFVKNDFGLHRKVADDARDARGTYRIYFSGHADRKDSMRTLVHEVAHNLWPEHFTPEAVQSIDRLANEDAARFTRFQSLVENRFPEFQKLFNAYKVANDQEKAAIIATTNEQFAANGMQAEGLFPYLRDAYDFKLAVNHVYDFLRIDGERYMHSNYASPQERFREILSRFAELKQVEYRGEPQFMQFLAPGLNGIWENHYLPHLREINHSIDQGTFPAHYDASQPKAQQDTAATAIAPLVTQPPTPPTPIAPEPATIPQPITPENPLQPAPSVSVITKLQPAPSPVPPPPETPGTQPQTTIETTDLLHTPAALLGTDLPQGFELR